MRWLASHGATVDTLTSGPRKETSLHVAVASRALLAVQALLDLKANPNQVDSNGQSPLQLASAANSISIARVLLDAKASIDSAQQQGFV